MGSLERTSWLGVNVVKCPFDLWLYQEYIVSARPDVIIETGTYMGGSAMFMASICDMIGHGRIYTIDKVRWAPQPYHPRITYLHGSSVLPNMVARVRDLIGNATKVLVVLDSDHTRDHVLEELRLYSPFVTPGSYVIVEDSNVNGHPVLPEFGPGPMEAINEFMLESNDFTIDRSREDRFLMTFNPSGWLRRD
jgi:cephalosporin hydroxylase